MQIPNWSNDGWLVKCPIKISTETSHQQNDKIFKKVASVKEKIKKKNAANNFKDIIYTGVKNTRNSICVCRR